MGFIGEEGIISSAFSYPPSTAWQQIRQNQPHPKEEKDGLNRDGEFGMKLFYWMKKTGFSVKDIRLIQPILRTRKEKLLLLEGHLSYKKTALAQGQTEQEWEAQRLELIRFAEDKNSIVGFYQSCQVCGVKE